MTTVADRLYTREEYLAIERAAETKSEYVNGRIVAVPVQSARHNVVTGNVAFALHSRFRNSPCRAFISNLRVRIEGRSRYVYPDVAALCGEPRFEDGVLDTLLNPALVVEVLSDSTEAYDRGDKFAGYRALESLREYVLVAQNRVSVERYQRYDDGWVYSALDDLSQTLELASVSCSVPLAEIYARVDFTRA
jgi:Uma2 family endonuclease